MLDAHASGRTRTSIDGSASRHPDPLNDEGISSHENGFLEYPAPESNRAPHLRTVRFGSAARGVRALVDATSGQATGESRSLDLSLTKRLLCRLSYGGGRRREERLVRGSNPPDSVDSGGASPEAKRGRERSEQFAHEESNLGALGCDPSARTAVLCARSLRDGRDERTRATGGSRTRAASMARSHATTNTSAASLPGPDSNRRPTAP